MKHKPSTSFFALSTVFSLFIGLGIGGLTPEGMLAAAGVFGLSCQLLAEVKDMLVSLNQPKEEKG